MTNQQQIIKVSRKELPLSCPRTADEVWNMHPLVFLPLKGADEVAVCPYCSASYQLSDKE
jgi:uncharacterized Zn-finger protein